MRRPWWESGPTHTLTPEFDRQTRLCGGCYLPGCPDVCRYGPVDFSENRAPTGELGAGHGTIEGLTEDGPGPDARTSGRSPGLTTLEVANGK